MQNSSDKPLHWDDIRFFLALSRQGSLSGAARALNVEHSTVARRVEALEHALGLRLFDRFSRGWQLTPEGEALSQHAQSMEHEALALSRSASGVSPLHGTVRISAPPVLASHFVAEQMGEMRRRWPDIMLELVAETHEANLTRREADLALRLSRPETHNSLVARAIAEIGFGLYATQEWLECSPADWVFLGFDDSLSHTSQERWLQQYAQNRRFALRSNNLTILYHGACAGLGVALLPHFLGVRDPHLKRLAQYESPDARQLWLVVHHDLRRSPRVRMVADALAALCAQHQTLLSGK